MRDYRILIKPFEYVALLDIKIYKCINEHAAATVLMRIKEEKMETYMNLLMEEQKITIEAENNQQEHKIILFGVVVDFSFNLQYSDTILKMEIVSTTFYMDIKTHFRTFQEPQMSSAQISKLLVKDYVGGCIYQQNKQKNKITRLLIQYEETDWEFAKRVASLENSFIVPFFSKNNVGYYIGFPTGTVRTLEKDIRICFNLDNGKYLIKKSSGIDGISEANEIELEVESREIYDIGDVIKYNSKDYFIYRIESRYEGGECLHTYFLKTEIGLKTVCKYNMAIRGCSFEATVIEVEKDKVKIELLNDENDEMMVKKWFLYATIYSSPDGSGWYYMPEIGDNVRLYVPENEEDAFVVSAIHKETDNSRQNPDYKSLKTKYGKEILFTPETLIMTNNKGMTIELSDKEGISIISNKDIIIQSDENITIGSQDESILIAAQDKLQMKQGETGMTLSEDISFIGGEFRMQ